MIVAGDVISENDTAILNLQGKQNDMTWVN